MIRQCRVTKHLQDDRIVRVSFRDTEAKTNYYFDLVCMDSETLEQRCEYISRKSFETTEMLYREVRDVAEAHAIEIYKAQYVPIKIATEESAP